MRRGQCAQKGSGARGAHLEAPLALDVHEEGVGRLHQPLALVLLLLEIHGRVQQIDVTRQHLRARKHVGPTATMTDTRSLLFATACTAEPGSSVPEPVERPGSGDPSGRAGPARNGRRGQGGARNQLSQSAHDMLLLPLADARMHGRPSTASRGSEAASGRYCWTAKAVKRLDASPVVRNAGSTMTQRHAGRQRSSSSCLSPPSHRRTEARCVWPSHPGAGAGAGPRHASRCGAADARQLFAKRALGHAPGQGDGGGRRAHHGVEARWLSR